MKARILQRAVVGIAALGLLAPPTLVSAGGPSANEPPAAESPAAELPEQAVPAAVVLDVALAPGGVFSGQVVDAQGRPQGGATVMVCQQQQVVATATTDSQGEFSIRGLQGGMYQVVTGQGMQSYRLWAPETAPPSARQSALLVAGGETLRGQSDLRRFLTNPWVLSAAVATAIIVPIALTIHDQSSSS